MSNNLGAIDRAIRIALGVVLISLIRFGPQTAWGYLGFGRPHLLGEAVDAATVGTPFTPWRRPVLTP